MSSGGTAFDALLLLSFGGPRGPEEVMPFLRNVVSGRNVPESRLAEVAKNYESVSGVSPINAQNEGLLEALRVQLDTSGIQLPLYWGNRNWHPFLADSLRRMAEDGVRSALAFVTSAYSSYSGCRQYLEDIERARREVGEKAPLVEKLRPYFNHPGFIEPNRERLREAIGRVPPEGVSRAEIFFTAHSLPVAMAEQCDYAAQLVETARLVAEASPPGSMELPWKLVYQSRSGPPSVPWLEPDVLDALEEAARRGVEDVILSPIGFVSDHMEVVYDLDTQARTVAEASGIRMVRAATVGTHPRFVEMILELVEERLGGAGRPALGRLGPRPDRCAPDCCPPSHS